jgi:hypothetical protein
MTRVNGCGAARAAGGLEISSRNKRAKRLAPAEQACKPLADVLQTPRRNSRPGAPRLQIVADSEQSGRARSGLHGKSLQIVADSRASAVARMERPASARCTSYGGFGVRRSAERRRKRNPGAPPHSAVLHAGYAPRVPGLAFGPPLQGSAETSAAPGGCLDWR